MTNKVIISGWFAGITPQEIVLFYKVESRNGKQDALHIPINEKVYEDLLKYDLNSNCVVSIEGEISYENGSMTIITNKFSIDKPAERNMPTIEVDGVA